ncbi:NAD(P)-dependent alcohol dehydrogenase [Lactobacillus sp. ESL0703]|uniref:NAD(P)-dependent alcohol dehydrogenase n=1 Tax=Lactobacillus sp. ESL0703 TaxID=2983218 RepID=UPI0023F883E2|nr:NAD(P)-dependent alcohol dehydrogenase [Lactobacillus sp. ESL0703]MDF7668590.1 NAD(P)-dependent alcohol dehydrogenase [Lactobacillus sp. ESL0703]
MKAVAYYKNVLSVIETDKPVPKDNEVLVKVIATTLNILDYNRFEKRLPIKAATQNNKGKILGVELSGVVVSCGKNMANFKIGDEVYGKTSGVIPTGAWAEYAILDKDNVYFKPKELTFEQAAAIPSSFSTALGAIRRTEILPGQNVLVYGASGGVGQYIVQIAQAQGGIVTGVCSTRNVKMAHKIGAKYVIDYKTEDFTQVKRKFDVVFGINGCNPTKKYKKVMKSKSTYVGVGNTQQGILAMISSLFNVFTSKKVSFYTEPLMPVKDYLPYANELVKQGELTPFIDKVYAIENIAEAIKYVITRHVQGKVVIDVDFD